MPLSGRAPSNRWRILLVEDDEDDYVYTRDLLAECPEVFVELDWVSTVEDAREHIVAKRHDLFLFDYRLGEHTGLDLLHFALSHNVSTPAILLTGNASHELDMQAMRAGAVYYLLKNQLNAQSLERSIRYALERKRNEDILRHVQEDLERRVAERTSELQVKNKELETFTYSVSHDLKAPLRGIDGYSRLLLEDHAAALDEEGRRFLHTIRAAVMQMGTLIDDLLAYSRLERRSLVPTVVDVKRLVEELVSERDEELRAAGVTLHVEMPAVGVVADVEGLAQALRNLVDNALKFTRGAAEPRVEITVRTDDRCCVLTVRDNGIGFDMRYHDHIFGIFQRLHRAEEYPGTGVGLALVKKAADRMGGRVWAESAPQRGAAFYLELPRGRLL